MTVLHREFDDVLLGELDIMNSTTSKKVPLDGRDGLAELKRPEPSRRIHEDDLEPLSPFNLEKRTKDEQIRDLHRIQCERKLNPPGRRIG